jgi:hypothetical protein
MQSPRSTVSHADDGGRRSRSLDAGGGSLARCLERCRAPARVAAAGPFPPHLPPGGPGRHASGVTAPARAARPSSSRRALCRRAKITVKSAPYGRVLRMALRATPDCDLPRQRSGSYQEDGGEDAAFWTLKGSRSAIRVNDLRRPGSSAGPAARAAIIHICIDTIYCT